MTARSWIFTFTLILTFVLDGYTKDIRRIIRAIEKGDLEKTMELIQSSLEDDWANPGAKYFLAKHLAYDSLAFFDIDSARSTILQGISDFEVANEDILEELVKNNLSLEDLQGLSKKIEDQHWYRALGALQVSVFQTFLDNYPRSAFSRVAEQKRDSLYWQEIRYNYSLDQYQAFLDDFKDSYLFGQVQAAYDSLLYFSWTESNRIEDYEDFLRRNPYTPYRYEAEKVIFSRSTIANRPEDFLDFAQKYWSKPLVKKAYDIHYYQTGVIAESHPDLDSLRRVIAAGLDPFFVQLKSDTFYLSNANGQVLERSVFNKVTDQYLCGGNTSDLVIGYLGGSWVIQNRLGQEIYTQDLTGFVELGYGLVFLEDSNGGTLLHKSGFVVAKDLEAATILEDRWIRVQQNGKFGMVSYAGYEIFPVEYEEIRVSGDFWVFERDGKVAALNSADFEQQVINESVQLDFQFDDVEVARDSLIIGFSGSQEALFDSQFERLIPWGDYEIYPGIPFHYTRADSIYQLYGDFRLGGQLIRANKLRESQSWMALKVDSTWSILNKLTDSIFASGLDSASLVGDFMVMAFYPDSINLCLSTDTTILLSNESRVAEVSFGQRPPTHFTVTRRSDMTIYNKEGKELFQDNYQGVKQLNDTLFAVTKGNKTGIMKANGETLIRPYYELIEEDDGLLFLLRDGKIGAFHLDSLVQFDVKYESRLVPFGDLYKTKSGGFFGLIDIDQKEVLPFEFEDITFWNDSLAWVLQDASWSLQNILSGESILEGVQRINTIFDRGHMKFSTYFKEDGLGLVDETGRVLLKPKFNEITNVGSSEEPVFLVELYSEEAEYYVVFYLNKDGERIASNAYTPREYDKLLCDD